MSAPRNRLITVPFSHYCEKARWALDHRKEKLSREAGARDVGR